MYFAQLDMPTSAMWTYWLPTVLFAVFGFKAMTFYRRFRALPPSPPGLPMLGNVFQLPAKLPALKLSEWAQELGPVFSLNMAGHPVIVLNTFKAAGDLLDRRSRIYSDRPRLIMVGDIMTGGKHVAFAPYGDMWRRMRRVAHEGINMRAIERYKKILEREAAIASINLAEAPQQWFDHLKRATAVGISSALYGWPSTSDKHAVFIERIQAHTARILEAAAPGNYLVDIVPGLEYAPLWMAKWKRDGVKWQQRETEFFMGLYREVHEELSGNSPQCFVSELIDNRDRYELSDQEAAWLTGSLFSAGAETAAGSLAYFIQAMLLFPQVMSKAQSELDNVVGRGRVPSFEDQKRLPYVEAMVKELLRWRPIGHLALPRKVTEDDLYEGYLIPKGATIIPNIWAMNRDPKFFPDFDEFRPERFFEAIPEDTHSTGHVTFGFGRRMCAGHDFANQTLFITIATILWALNLDKVKDSDGKLVIPSKDDFVETGVTVEPAPFPCEVTPRFSEALSLLRRQLAEGALSEK